MEFCDNCQNMMYVEVVTDENEGNTKPRLRHYCKNCKNSRESGAEASSIMISDKSQFDASEIAYKAFMTPYIKHDPTLPRVTNIKCPNTKCTIDQGKSNEVIYIKYDSDNMKFLYYCCHCGHFWR